MIFKSIQELFLSIKKNDKSSVKWNSNDSLLSDSNLSTPSQKLRLKERNGTKGQLI